MSDNVKVFQFRDGGTRIEVRNRWMIVQDHDVLELATELIDYIAERGN